MIDLIQKVYKENKNSGKLSSQEVCDVINKIGLAYRRHYNLSPIDLEIIMNNKEEVSRIIKSGEVDINVPTTTGYLPLVTATNLSNYDISDLLINNDARVNVEGDYIPLHIASSKKNYALMKLLKDNGADVNKKDKNGFNSLHYLLDDGILADLREGIPYSYPFGVTFKNNANDREIIRCSNLLLDSGIDVNCKGKSSYVDFDRKLVDVNPLSIALEEWGFEVTENLINNDAERKAVEIWPDGIYEYQSTLDYIKEFHDLFMLINIPKEYKKYLEYIRKIKEFDIQVFSTCMDDEYKRPKMIKRYNK